MSRKTVAIALMSLAGLMLFGFLRSNASITAPATIAAVLITVVAPAVGGVVLLRGRDLARSRRLDVLRQQTIDAEILKLAVKEQGHLTATDVATYLALTPETAKTALDSLMERGLADIAITDRGVIVYTFHDAKHIGDKSSAKGVLDA